MDSDSEIEYLGIVNNNNNSPDSPSNNNDNDEGEVDYSPSWSPSSSSSGSRAPSPPSPSPAPSPATAPSSPRILFSDPHCADQRAAETNSPPPYEAVTDDKLLTCPSCREKFPDGLLFLFHVWPPGGEGPRGLPHCIPKAKPEGEDFEAWKESVRKGNIELQYSIFTIKNDVFERDSPRVLSPDQGQLRGKLSSFAGPVQLESDEEVGRDHQEEPTAGPSHRAQEADTVSAQPIRKRPWRITPIQFP